MKFAQANIRSLNTSFDTLETVCTSQEVEIWHPDSQIIINIKRRGIGSVVKGKQGWWRSR